MTKPSSPTTFEWTHESDETTHISVVDAERNAVSMTYTLEQGYGVKIVPREGEERRRKGEVLAGWEG